MYCEKCGAQLAEDAAFCTGCGTPIHREPTAAQLASALAAAPPPAAVAADQQQYQQPPQYQPTQPQEQPPQYQQPQQYQPYADQQQFSGQPGFPPAQAPAAKKSKGPLIAIIAAAVVVVIVALLVILFVVKPFGGSDRSDPAAPGADAAALPSDVQIQISQVDNAAFPSMTLYAYVTDGESQPVSSLAASQFRITEVGEDGTQYPATITELAQVTAADVVNINLVLDQSGSMDDDNKMENAKRAADTFLDQIIAESGNDQTAITSFDDYVYPKQGFTNDRTALQSAINNLQPAGGTALYDALYTALQQTNAQSGSRVVIAFTDGEENASRHSLNNVIELSRLTGIPVYIVGIGDELDVATLKRLAADCNGEYFDASVSNLSSSLEGIYGSIYRIQRSLCRIVYTTDYTGDEQSYRTLELVAVDGGNAIAQANTSYMPKDNVADRNLTRIDPALINSEFARLKSQYGARGDISLSVILNNEDTIYGTSNDTTAQPASALINIPILYTIANEIADGNMTLDSKVTFRYTVGGRTKLPKSASGNKYTVRQLLSYALQYSDNNAINSLLSHLGIAKVNRICQQNGYSSVDLQRLIVPNATSKNNYVSAADLAGMLDEIYSDRFPLGRSFLESYFAIQDSLDRSGIGKDIPGGYTFLNHNGVTTILYNEIAIVSDGQRTCIVTFLSNGGKVSASKNVAAALGRYVINELMP